MDTYKIVKIGAAVAAPVVVAVYVFALWLALADGDRAGFEIPVGVATGSTAIAVVLLLVAACAWLVERGVERAAKRILVPIVEAAIREELRLQTPIVARGVAQVVARGVVHVVNGMELQMRQIANKAGDRTVARTREMMTGEVTEIINAGIDRVQRYGMIRGAQTNGRKVVPIREIREMSPGD